jgi:hypothetical protein
LHQVIPCSQYGQLQHGGQYDTCIMQSRVRTSLYKCGTEHLHVYSYTIFFKYSSRAGIGNPARLQSRDPGALCRAGLLISGHIADLEAQLGPHLDIFIQLTNAWLTLVGRLRQNSRSARAFTHICACKHVCVCVCCVCREAILTNLHTSTYTLNVCLYVCLYMIVYVFMYVCICSWLLTSGKTEPHMLNRGRTKFTMNPFCDERPQFSSLSHMGDMAMSMLRSKSPWCVCVHVCMCAHPCFCVSIVLFPAIHGRYCDVHAALELPNLSVWMHLCVCVRVSTIFFSVTYSCISVTCCWCWVVPAALWAPLHTVVSIR